MSALHVNPEFQPLLRRLGLDADSVFDHPRIRVWRKLDDRENCTLDDVADNGEPIRLHIKRYTPVTGATPADVEFAGHQLLVDHGLATAPLVAWGVRSDRRSFTLWMDLAGFTPADKLIAGGVAFEALLDSTAAMAGQLHKAGLHHRDLYLCHFMVRPSQIGSDPPAIKLIDTARVARLPRLLTRRRWIVKDLAQFWYSTLSLAIDDAQRERWLEKYADVRGDVKPGSLRAAIERKVRSIARHDLRLRRKQPGRNVSIPVEKP